MFPRWLYFRVEIADLAVSSPVLGQEVAHPGNDLFSSVFDTLSPGILNILVRNMAGHMVDPEPKSHLLTSCPGPQHVIDTIPAYAVLSHFRIPLGEDSRPDLELKPALWPIVRMNAQQAKTAAYRCP